MVDPANGVATQPWYRFFVTLWNRTGGTVDVLAPPPGSITAFGGPSVNLPTGWLICDGSLISRTIYPNLFTAIGSTWGGGDGSSTFALPDLRDRFLAGGGFTYPVGTEGGEAEITLDVASLAAHSHGITDPGHGHGVTDPTHVHTVTDPGHVHTARVAASNVTAGAAAGGDTAGNTGSSVTGVTVDAAATGVTVNNNTTGVSVDSTGSGDPVAIIPPYAAVLYIIKT